MLEWDRHRETHDDADNAPTVACLAHGPPELGHLSLAKGQRYVH